MMAASTLRRPDAHTLEQRRAERNATVRAYVRELNAPAHRDLVEVYVSEVQRGPRPTRVLLR